MPSGKLTYTLADRGWKIHFHSNRAMFKVYVNLPEGNITVKPLSFKKHCVLWDKMHMSMIMAFILQRTA